MRQLSHDRDSQAIHVHINLRAVTINERVQPVRPRLTMIDIDSVVRVTGERLPDSTYSLSVLVTPIYLCSMIYIRGALSGRQISMLILSILVIFVSASEL